MVCFGFPVGVLRDFCKLCYTSGLYQQSLYLSVNLAFIMHGKLLAGSRLLATVR